MAAVNAELIESLAVHATQVQLDRQVTEPCAATPTHVNYLLGTEKLNAIRIQLIGFFNTYRPVFRTREKAT